MGGIPFDDPEVATDFDLVVNATDLEALGLTPMRRKIYGRARVIAISMLDGPLDDSIVTQVRRAASDVADALRMGKRVLVHCAQGWNRSGLITGAALVDLGVDPQSAIALIRQHRHPMALSNPHYTAWLMRLGPSLQADLAEQEEA
jgi:protein-tyrosine phosphatase